MNKLDVFAWIAMFLTCCLFGLICFITYLYYDSCMDMKLYMHRKTVQIRKNRCTNPAFDDDWVEILFDPIEEDK